jgi:ABC-type dipeptide/oligopeptide/nickel transport system permease subunit
VPLRSLRSSAARSASSPAFFGGRTDTALHARDRLLLVIPDVPLMIVIAALFGRSTWNIIHHHRIIY